MGFKSAAEGGQIPEGQCERVIKEGYIDNARSSHSTGIGRN